MAAALELMQETAGKVGFNKSNRDGVSDHGILVSVDAANWSIN